MANRIIYQSDALYASKSVRSTGIDEHQQLRRVQSANYSFNVNRTDVNQFGQLARIDSTILETPTVSVDLSYLLGDGYNESALGFSFTSGSLATGFISNQISATSEQATSGINLYMLTTPEGVDANVARTTQDFDNNVIGLGNCYLSDYTVDASVGDFPTVTVSLEGLNANSTTGVVGVTGLGAHGGDIEGASAAAEKNHHQASFGPKVLSFGVGGHPRDAGLLTGSDGETKRQEQVKMLAVDPEDTNFIGASGAVSGVGVNVVDGNQLSVMKSGIVLEGPSEATGVGQTALTTALKPGDMTLTLTNGKSFFNVDASDSSAGHVQSISLSVPLSRTPIEKLGSTFAFARVADFPITPTLSVSAVVNSAKQQALHDIIANDDFIDQLSFSFSNTAGAKQVEYTLKNAKIESESVSSSIGPNKTVDLTFSVTIGGPDDTNNNIFFSGQHGHPDDTKRVFGSNFVRAN